MATETLQIKVGELCRREFPNPRGVAFSVDVSDDNVVSYQKNSGADPSWVEIFGKGPGETLVVVSPDDDQTNPV